MKAILKFDLEDFDDRVAHERAVKSTDLALALWQFAYNTRKGIEWDIESQEEKGEKINAYETVDMLYKKFWEILEEHNIILDKLIV